MNSPRFEDGLVVGNTYQKYTTGNPIERRLVRGFLKSFDTLVQASEARSILEVGCGEGELAIRCAEAGLEVHGTDISESMIRIASVRAAERDLSVTFSVDDIYDIAPPERPPDLLVCCEVLEHLEDPDRAMEHLVSLNARAYLLSVPNEPLWRMLNVARGKYLMALGNTPGHVQHWSRKRFLGLVGRRFQVLEERNPTPWTMVLARL